MFVCFLSGYNHILINKIFNTFVSLFDVWVGKLEGINNKNSFLVQHTLECIVWCLFWIDLWKIVVVQFFTLSFCNPPALVTSMIKTKATALGMYSSNIVFNSLESPIPGVSTMVTFPFCSQHESLNFLIID